MKMGTFSVQHRREGGQDRIWLSLTLLLISGISVSSAEETILASVRDLRAKLFESYDKLVRPVVLQTTVIPLRVGMTPLAVTEMDEEKQIIEMDTWIYMRWKDEYLVWNPEEFGGVTEFNIPSTEIWRPDLTIYTGSPANKVVFDVFTNAIVNFTGAVLWVPPVTIRSRCPQEVHSYQQNIVNCTIKIGSWTYHEYRLDFQLFNPEMKMEYFSNTNPHWELESITSERESKYYSCCREPYPSISYTVTMKRRPNCK